MSWKYSQSKGILSGEFSSTPVELTCYSGHGEGLNNPDMQDQHDIGPIPQGQYLMTDLYDSPHTGKSTIKLDPNPNNQMFGRDGFRIHGDNTLCNKSASGGCIICPGISIRQSIWAGGDRVLEVTE